MLKVKFLILLFSLTLLSNCNYYANIINDSKVTKAVHVEIISDKKGIILRNELLKYFPNTKFKTSEYVLEISIKNNSEGILRNSSGFSSKNKETYVITTKLSTIEEKSIILTKSKIYINTYLLDINQFSNNINEDVAFRNLAKTIASDTATSVITFLQKLKYQKTHDLPE